MNLVFIVLIAVGAALTITGTGLMIYRKLMRNRKRGNNNPAVRINLGYQSTENTVYTVPTNPAPLYSNHPSHLQRQISQNGDMFQVPLELIPSSFDYNADGVVRKGNYVLIKDLSMIERRNSTQSVHRSHEEYLKQQPYNPEYQHY